MQGAFLVQYVVRSHVGVFELRGDGRDYRRGGTSAEAAALQYEHGPLSPLFAADCTVKSGVVDFAASNTLHFDLPYRCSGPGAALLRLARFTKHRHKIRVAPGLYLKEEPSNGG